MRCEAEVVELETDLVGALRHGDPSGAERLVERYGDRVYRLALLVTGVAADAEEIVREVLVAAVKVGHAIPREASLDLWVSRAAAALAYRKLRARGPRAEPMTGDRVAALGGDDARRPIAVEDWTKRAVEPAAGGRLSAAIAEALDDLPAEDRIVLVLRDVEGLSRADIAEVLGTDVRSVTSSVHRARLRAQTHLSRHFARTAPDR